MHGILSTYSVFPNDINNEYPEKQRASNPQTASPSKYSRNAINLPNKQHRKQPEQAT